MDRKAIFRAASQRFDPNTFGEDADVNYVARPEDTPGDDVANALRLDPVGAHVLLGAIGLGKTTELIRAAARLREGAPDVLVVNADADLLGSGLTEAFPGLLQQRVAEALAFAALERSPALPLIAQQAVARILDRERQSRSGLLPENDLSPTESAPNQDLRLVRENLRGATSGSSNAPIVVLLDSFDRLRPPDEYIEAVVTDLPALARLRIGLVVTGSLELLYGRWREHLQRFDRYHVVRPLDPARDAHRNFLDHVLCQRDTDGLFDPFARDRLIRASGGHLRSLMQLAQEALERAERGAAMTITAADAESTSQRFAANFAEGMLPSKLALLRRVASGDISPTIEDELVTLLRDGWVFENAPGTARYRVHPALEALLVSQVA